MKKRLVSAIVMILTLTPIMILGDYYFAFLCVMLGLMSLWEMLRLEKEIPSLMKILCYFWCLFLILYKYKEVNYIDVINYPILFLMFLFFSISVIINGDLKKYNYKDSIWLMVVTLLVGLLYNSMIRVRNIGLNIMFYCLIISVATDTFAYFGGKMCGKKKISPSISPNKTIAGSVIGSIVGTIIASVYYYYCIGNTNVEVIILLSCALTLLCQCGDLFFSSIKRFYGVKDYSNFIPGHGGILDRVDSTLFVLVGFLLFRIFF